MADRGKNESSPINEQRVLLSSPDADVLLSALPEGDGKRTLTVVPKSSAIYIPRREIRTAYSDELILLILRIKGVSDLCDEIARDEDPTYVSDSLEIDLFSIFPRDFFAGKRVLDFGCGSGASVVILSRLLKGADVWGVELDERLLQIANARAIHYGLARGHMIPSLNANTLPAGLGTFDVVVLSAVWEHLLPSERPEVLRQIWSLLRPGGHFFLNQTPHRFSPVEMHTTGLPLINYLPDRLTLSAVRRFSNRVRPDVTWESLLRRGIRGGTQTEILRLITHSCEGRAISLDPLRSENIKDFIDLWYAKSAQSRLPALKRCVWAFLKCVKMITGAQIVPSLTLVVKKQA